MRKVIQPEIYERYCDGCGVKLEGNACVKFDEYQYHEYTRDGEFCGLNCFKKWLKSDELIDDEFMYYLYLDGIRMKELKDVLHV